QPQKAIGPHQSCFTRCSRPLYSSQTTTPSHPPPTHPTKEVTCRLRPCAGQSRKNTTQHPAHTPKEHHAKYRGLLFQDPTVCQKTIHNHENHYLPTRKRAY